MAETTSGENALADWLSVEQGVLQALEAGVGVGVVTPAKIGSLTGLEVMRTMMRGELPYAACAKTNRFYAVAAEPGKATFQGIPSADQLNPMGTVNGGWMSSILDSALGSAVLTTLEPGWGYFTVDLNVQYLKMLTLGTQRVRAVAEVVDSDGRDVRAKATLVGPDGKVFAEATTVCRLMTPQGKSVKP